MELHLKRNTSVLLISLLMFSVLFITACNPLSDIHEDSGNTTQEEATSSPAVLETWQDKWNAALVNKSVDISSLRLYSLIDGIISTSPPYAYASDKETIGRFIGLFGDIDLNFQQRSDEEYNTLLTTTANVIDFLIKINDDENSIEFRMYDNGRLEYEENGITYVSDTSLNYDGFKVFYDEIKKTGQS